MSDETTGERDLAVFKAELADVLDWDEVGIVDPDRKVTLPGHVILLAHFLLSRTMTVLQWVGLGLIVTSVIAMQMATLVQSRKR